VKKGMLDLVTLVEKEDIDITIAYIRSILEVDSSPTTIAKWAEFWKYFDKNWLKGPFPFEMWNLTSAYFDDEALLVEFLSNNALENFNGQIGSKFHHPHPTIYALIKVIKQISIDMVDRLQRIRENKELSPKRPPIIPVV
jgi:hypothetical protein